MTLNGVSESASGYAVIVWDSSTTGKIYGAGNALIATFTMNGNDLTTYSGVTPLSGTTITYEEWDHWTRISNTASVQTQALAPEEEGEAKSLGWIAEHLVP